MGHLYTGLPESDGNILNGPELTKDLAESLWAGGQMVWTQMPLGSVQVENAPIADVFALKKEFRPQATIYEVKVSRGDFFRDVNSGKYERYLPHCRQLFFAVPAGLVKREEVPEGCGLTVRGEHSWRAQKPAPVRNWEPTTSLMLALLFRGYADFRENRDLRLREVAASNRSLAEDASAHGIRIAQDIAQGEKLLATAQVLQEEICQALGRKLLPNDFWNAESALRLHVRKLLNQHRFLPQAITLAKVSMEFFEGQHGMWSVYEVQRAGEQLVEMATKMKEDLEAEKL